MQIKQPENFTQSIVSFYFLVLPQTTVAGTTGMNGTTGAATTPDGFTPTALTTGRLPY